VEARSELWGEKRVSLKPPMDVPAIAWSHEAHSPRSYHEIDQCSLDRNREAPFEYLFGHRRWSCERKGLRKKI
jgi:hypothetical protein